MVVCIFEHVQWRWALNDRLALGYPAPARQESLYSVVRAYALYDREIGYCQVRPRAARSC
jgi:hypothetical protein